MKKNYSNLFYYLAFCTLSLSMASVVHAQEKNYESLTNSNGGFKPGFTINPSFNYSSVGKGDLFSFNIAGGLVFKDIWTVGAFYNTSVNNFRPEKLIVPDAYADVRYGGLHLEYTVHANKVFHLSFPLQFGFGEIELDTDNEQSSSFGEEKFWVINPGVMGEVNIHPNVRLQAGLNYRFATSFDYQNLDASDISGLVFQVGLRAGIFNKVSPKK
jgi:hypothetical protein